MKRGWILLTMGLFLLGVLPFYFIGSGPQKGVPTAATDETPPVAQRVTPEVVQAATQEVVQTATPQEAEVPLGLDGLPTVSLHVKDAGLEEVVAALNGQLTVEIAARRVAVPGGDGGTYVYSADVTRRTFWEVIGLLDDQCLMNVHERGGVISLDGNAHSAGAHAVSGPFFLQVFERPITQSKPPSLGMQYIFLADPRLKVASVTYSFSAQTTRRGQTFGRSGTFSPLEGTAQTGHSVGASASGFMQHGWETDVKDVVTTVTASATYTLESGEEKKGEFQLQVGQPEH